MVGWSLSLIKTGVASWKKFQIFIAVFLLTKDIKDTWSQPVKAWKNGNASVFSSPRCCYISWTGKKRLFFPIPTSIHNSPKWSFNLWNIEILRINTSVSTVLMVILFDQMCLECKNTHVSASSWFDGDNKSMFNVGLLLQDTSSKAYTRIVSVSASKGSNCVEINLNNSVLFSSIRKNAFQFAGLYLSSYTFPMFQSSLTLQTVLFVRVEDNTHSLSISFSNIFLSCRFHCVDTVPFKILLWLWHVDKNRSL